MKISTFIFIFLTFSLVTNSQDSLLTLDELNSLKLYKIGMDWETGAWRTNYGEILNVDSTYPEIENAIFYTTHVGKMDTLNISQKMFPQLKKATFEGIFYNELNVISTLKTLQYLDISELSQGDLNINWYNIYFPEEFWNLNQLQYVYLTASHLSDVSDRFTSFNHLKLINVEVHKFQYHFFTPWTLYLDSNRNIENNFRCSTRSCPVFFQVNDRNHLDTIGALFKYQGDTLVYKTASSEFRLPLNADHTKIHGYATLHLNGELVQYRNYKNGLPHGKWYMNNEGCVQKRFYKNGMPVRKWKINNHARDEWNGRQAVSFRRKGRRIRIHHPPIPTIRVTYKDYSDMVTYRRIKKRNKD